MRFKETTGTYKIYAVTGSNTIAFGIDCTVAAMKDLLGFSVEKEYTNSNGDHVKVMVMGFKVFKERIENPTPGALYSTFDNPIQSFTWEDFTAYPGSKYTYHFTPLFDSPLNIRRGPVVSINVETEPAWKNGDHSIFFNRGVASSQAYAIKFGNQKPEDVGEEAFRWLSRGLKEAIVAFIKQAQNGDTIYGCFYEFRNDEILNAFREVAEIGVNLELIYDAKENEHTDSQTGNWVESFPKVENEEAIQRAGLNNFANVTLIPRDRNKSYLSHNKLMILAKNGTPQKVWTGSTNISKGGIFGQANVGHSVDNAAVAAKFMQYWNAVKSQPPSGDLKQLNEQIQGNLAVSSIPAGMSCIFSPRTNLQMLQFYADLLDSSKECSCITLAFGVHNFFATAISDNTANSPLTFLLLERDDADISDYVYQNNVIKAVGSYIGENVLFKWVKETSTNSLQLNTHVMFVHTKFLLSDPLSKDPIVVTGSANFSQAATDTNDENMIIIRGNKRVADIYFTEYLRLFNHYYFRWVVRKTHEQGTLDADNPAFLEPGDKWTEQYKPGKYKSKKVKLFSNMHI